MRDLHAVQLPGGLVGEPANQLNQIFRMRAEIHKLTQRQLGVEATEAAALEDEIQNRVREVRRLYRALLPLFAKRRESIHVAQRTHATCAAAFRRSTIELAASDRWAKVPGNVEDMVPHNVLLPAGVVYSMQQSIAEGTAFVLARPNRYRSDEATFGTDAHGQVSQEALREALSQVKEHDAPR